MQDIYFSSMTEVDSEVHPNSAKELIRILTEETGNGADVRFYLGTRDDYDGEGSIRRLTSNSSVGDEIIVAMVMEIPGYHTLREGQRTMEKMRGIANLAISQKEQARRTAELAAAESDLAAAQEAAREAEARIAALTS